MKLPWSTGLLSSRELSHYAESQALTIIDLWYKNLNRRRGEETPCVRYFTLSDNGSQREENLLGLVVSMGEAEPWGRTETTEKRWVLMLSLSSGSLAPGMLPLTFGGKTWAKSFWKCLTDWSRGEFYIPLNLVKPTRKISSYRSSEQ